MAKIKNQDLKMGRVTSSIEYAEVSFKVDFSAKEVQENLNYRYHVVLYEQDNALDTYIAKSNGLDLSIYRRSMGNLDDFVKWLESKSIRPNGQSTRSFTVRKEFNVGNQESGNEEYRAFIYIVPEITMGQAWTEILPINLG